MRSPLFVASTILLMALASSVALAPIAIRYLDRQTVTRIAVVADDAQLGAMTIAVTDSILNVPPGGTDPDKWEKPFRLELAASLDDANAALAARNLGGVMIVVRGCPRGQLDVTYRTNGPADGVRSQLVGFAASPSAILDWTAALPDDVASSARSRRRPSGSTRTSVPTERRQADRSAGGREPRRSSGVVFVVLLFLSVIIYGMWVATGVAVGEEQPGHGADDQRGLAAPAADRQGRRDRRRRADPVPRDRASRRSSSSRSRTGSPWRSSGPTAPRAPRSSG